MKIKAAVVKSAGSDYAFETLELQELAKTDVLVKMVASGICRSDHTERLGNLTPFPLVLGHEGAGIVEKIGPDVTDLAVGDHVIITYANCGKCIRCNEGHPSSCFQWSSLNLGGVNFRGEHVFKNEQGEDINNFYIQSSFATYSLADESNLVKVPKEIDLRILGPLGCGLGTGSGSVMNVLQPKAGSSIVVIGTGAVGFGALMAAKIVGCTTIIAVDINEERLKLAKELGATQIFNSQTQRETLVSEIMALTNGIGVDYVVDTSGYNPIMKQALEFLTHGGTFVPLAVSKTDFSLNTFVDLVIGNKKMEGALIGNTIPKHHLLRLINYYQQGQFPFDKFIKFYDFDEIITAEADLISGRTLKSVLVIDKTYQPPKAGNQNV